ncbi:MAG TPA: hypothetical protein VHK01_14220 [Lacipirellulaceae bacterium]|nr:hypothetical protein [Lacipirellulaceae bacterium]
MPPASPTRLLIFAVLLPAVVAGTNQWIYDAIPTHDSLQTWLHPWMAFTTAVLSWCSGRHLLNAWIRWIVFAWCLVLLDLLTLAATQDNRIPDHFGYLLVSSQISLLVIWAVLGAVSWQWRLPAVLAVSPLVIGFSGAISGSWWGQAWNVTMIFATVAVALVSVWLRWRGFRLERPKAKAPSNDEIESMAANQFGIKHMLVWATAIVPLLLLLRGIDFLVLGGVQDLESAFAATAVASSLATVNLVAIWAVLGGGLPIVRIALLLVMPPLFATALVYYSKYIGAKYGPTWPNVPMLDAIYSMHDYWVVWLWSDAALLAALLLFLRACGYRLLSRNRATTAS